MQRGQRSDDSDDIGFRWASNPTVDVAAVEAEFEEEAARYDENLRAWDYRVPRDSTEILAQYVARSSKVLEAGCGTGLIGEAHRQVGYRNLSGCDLSAAMLEIAEAKGIYGKLRRVDLTQHFPYEDDEFDAVTCLATLSYIEDAEFTFREFCRITRPAGIVFFSHRRDLFETRNCLALCYRLEQEELWKKELHSDWKPYLPGHPAYTDELQVGYFVYRVR